MKSSTIIADFRSPAETVWKIVTDNADFRWRSDLSDLVVSEDGLHFSEFTKNGFETQFVITEKKPYTRYAFDIQNKNMRGRWTGVFSPTDGGTRVSFTEEVEIANPVMRLLAGSYLRKQQAAYIADLRKALGE